MWCKRIAILTLCVMAVACKKKVPDAELVAKVDGEGITKADFDAMVERNMARYKGQGHALPPGIETRIKESVLRRAGSVSRTTTSYRTLRSARWTRLDWWCSSTSRPMTGST